MQLISHLIHNLIITLPGTIQCKLFHWFHMKECSHIPLMMMMINDYMVNDGDHVYDKDDDDNADHDNLGNSLCQKIW